jgi:hypothetical protein
MPPLRLRRAAGLCLGAGLLMLAGCASEDEPAADAALPEVTLEEDPGLAHVHGLGVNPADDLLYVATHFGLWRVDDDGAERVGNHYLDLASRWWARITSWPAVWLARRASTSGSGPGREAAASASRALDILDQRYARGEITREEYLQVRRDLQGPG